jgi:hypothetical protein
VVLYSSGLGQQSWKGYHNTVWMSQHTIWTDSSDPLACREAACTTPVALRASTASHSSDVAATRLQPSGPPACHSTFLGLSPLLLSRCTQASTSACFRLFGSRSECVHWFTCTSIAISKCPVASFPPWRPIWSCRRQISSYATYLQAGLPTSASQGVFAPVVALPGVCVQGFADQLTDARQKHV